MRSILTAIAMCAAATAIASPPFQTDTARTIAAHAWDIHFETQLADNGSTENGTLPRFEMNYGQSRDLQLQLIVPFAWRQPPTVYGLGDVQFSARYRFYNRGAYQAALYPKVRFPTATRGLGNNIAQEYLPVWVQRNAGRWQTIVGGGFWHNPGNHDYWFTGAQVQNAISKKLSVGGEIFTATRSKPRGGARSGLNVGAIYHIDRTHHFLGSVGTDLHGPNRTSLFLDYQITGP